MVQQQSSRSKRLLELGRIGMESLIKDPVRESVRKALAEERMVAEVQAEGTRRRADEEQAEGTRRRADEEQAEGTRRRADEEQTGGGNRLLRPAVLLPALGLAAAVAISRRRRLMKLADEKGVLDQVDKAIPTHDTNQGTAADSDSTDTDDQTDYGGSDDVPDGKRPASFGNFDDDTGTEEPSDYEEDDTDDKELSTPE